MRKTTAILLALGCLATQGTAYAKGSPWYLGLKGGVVDAGEGVTDDAVNAGFDLGYRNNRYLATEIEYTDTLVEGETRGGADWEVSTLSAFAALRTATPVKVKGKLGVTHVEDSDDDLEFSWGVGLGFWAAGGLVELEYTELADELDYISLGVNYFY
jgi:hypothetical protein